MLMELFIIRVISMDIEELSDDELKKEYEIVKRELESRGIKTWNKAEYVTR